MLPDFDVDEQSTIENVSQNGSTLVFLYFKGHACLAGRGNPYTGCLQGVTGHGQMINLEAFLANIARSRNVFAMGMFDSCRRLQVGEQQMAFNPALHSSENLAIMYRERVQEAEPGQCSCQDIKEGQEPLVSRFFQHLDK